jgi:hypothetical protein
MTDQPIHHRINELAEEEEALYAKAGSGEGLDGADVERLRMIQVELDRAYDLLHQRDARRAAGLDPDAATPRPAEIVEHYQQ